MENQINTADQNSQQLGQNPVSQTATIPKKPKINWLMMGGVALICSLVFGFAGYYLGKQSSNFQYSNGGQNQITPTVTPELNSPTGTSVSQQTALPTGWSYKNNGECGVRFAIPPKADPYYKPYDPNRPPSVTEDSGSGRFWDFPRGVVYPNLLSKLITGNQEYKQAATMYATVDEASGYVSSGVIVSCIPNSSNLNNLSMLNSLKSKLQEYNNGTSEEGMQASKYTIKTSNEVSRWNQKAYDLNMSEYYSNPGGQPITNSVEYTMFATPKFIYEVRVMGATDNAFVKDTAKKIFDNLSFQ